MNKYKKYKNLKASHMRKMQKRLSGESKKKSELVEDIVFYSVAYIGIGSGFICAVGSVIKLFFDIF